jgi:flagellar assembly protein FliH
MRIIKDAKITRDPVVIAMHKFDELVDPQDLSQQDSVVDSEAAAMTSMRNDETALKPSTESDYEQAAAEAEQVLQAARMDAEALLTAATAEVTRTKNAAETEAEELKRQAVLDGIQQGLAEAKLQMTEQMKQSAEQCNAIIEAASREAKQMVLGAERQIVELVLAIVRKIISDAMDDRPDIILGVVKEALERVKDQDRINVHVSLDDYEQILQSRNVLQGIVGLEKTVTVTADTVLSRGGCLIETSFGTVEAGIDSQLESIRKALQEMLP